MAVSASTLASHLLFTAMDNVYALLVQSKPIILAQSPPITAAMVNYGMVALV